MAERHPAKKNYDVANSGPRQLENLKKRVMHNIRAVVAEEWQDVKLSKFEVRKGVKADKAEWEEWYNLQDEVIKDITATSSVVKAVQDKKRGSLCDRYKKKHAALLKEDRVKDVLQEAGLGKKGRKPRSLDDGDEDSDANGGDSDDDVDSDDYSDDVDEDSALRKKRKGSPQEPVRKTASKSLTKSKPKRPEEEETEKQRQGVRQAQDAGHREKISLEECITVSNALSTSIGQAELWATTCKEVWVRMTDKERGEWLNINYHRFSKYAQCGVEDLEELHQRLEKLVVQIQDTEYIAATRPREEQ